MRRFFSILFCFPQQKLVTGDIAFSGKRAQYERAFAFFKTLSDQVIKITASQCSMAVVPGNHDCTFSADSSVRDLVLEKVRASGGECETDGYLRTCLEVQDEFFSWAKSTGLISSTSDRKHLAWHVNIALSNSKTLSLISCNTAWMSSLHEQQGHLRFPIANVPASIPADVVLTILHHPYNWFESSNARDLMHAIEEATDIILTGHEHEGTAFDKKVDEGPNVNYVEGPVLSDASGSASAFNVVTVDLDMNRYQTIMYAWDGEIAVGSEKLLPTYEDVRRVYDNRATEFVQMLIRLDHCKSFPEKKVALLGLWGDFRLAAA